MTPGEAVAIAREGGDYHCPEAVAPLLVASQDAAATEEDRRRAWYAVLALDRGMRLPEIWPTLDPIERWRGGPLEGVARAITDLVLTSFYSTDGRLRGRAATILAGVCRDATLIAKELGRVA
jgi:hypothetical protein